MCFSAQASFAAAAALTILGSLTVAKARTRAIVPLATMPLFFGLQQSFEGFVWITINTDYARLHVMSVIGFLFFAAIFWPLWTPFSLYILEKNKTRQKLLLGTLSIGIFSAALSFLGWIYIPIAAHTMNNHIAYDYVTTQSFVTTWYVYAGQTFIYAVATIAPFFISSVAYIWFLGIIIAIGFVVAQTFYYCAFGSVWCFFAALASSVMYGIVTRYHGKKL